MNLLYGLFSLLLCVSLTFACERGPAPLETAGTEQSESDDPFAGFESAAQTYATYCASCHGQQMQAFVDRRWQNGNSAAQIRKSIAEGNADAGMPAFGEVLAEAELDELVAYIQAGIAYVDQYGFTGQTTASDTLRSQDLSGVLEVVVDGLDIPYSMDMLPGGDMLVTDRDGRVLRVTADGTKTELAGVPQVRARGQGGMHHVLAHPNFADNQYIYLSYAAAKTENGKEVTTTKVTRHKLQGNQLSDEVVILEALPYTQAQHHFGSVMHFDAAGKLFITVGDRGDRDVNPQDLSRFAGKVHRVNDDGSIPADNPFVNDAAAVPSIYSYGHRNPQGLDLDPATGRIWEHEHGPRGGDEINIVEAGKNYGWPVISYGLNYDGTTFTNLLAKEGMEQPVHYWTPSIAPSGLAFITSERYAPWQGDLLVGSLRYQYLNLVHLEGTQVAGEEKLLQNIGRLRFVTEASDGFIYIGVERPGRVLRLRPL